MAVRGGPVKLACRLLEVSHSGFQEWRSRPASPMALCREWLTGVITEIHARSRGTYALLGCTPSFAWEWASWLAARPWPK
ncbi:hypothetical protein GCM10027436_15220 [Actinophytocola sediminis]